MRNHCTRTLKMYPEQWQRLEQLAHETNSRPRNGIDAYQPTWPALLRRIADGELILVERDRNPVRERQLKALDNAIEKNKQRERILPGQQSLFETEPAG
jgi:hypothetical protein